jgi:hypothetical protein
MQFFSEPIFLQKKEKCKKGKKILLLACASSFPQQQPDPPVSPNSIKPRTKKPTEIPQKNL